MDDLQIQERSSTDPYKKNIETLSTFLSSQDRSGWNQVQWEAPHLLSDSLLPWIELDLPFEVPHQKMLEEAQNIRALMLNYRENDYDDYGHKGWRSVALHGISSTHTACHTDYGYSRELGGRDVPYRWTEVADLCPVTTDFFKNTFGYKSYQRVRFMLLEPGGFILPHRDGSDHFLWAVNMALSHPAGCEFGMKSFGNIPFRPGAAFKLDTSNPHCVWNNSNEDRFHIIVHGQFDEDFWFPIFRKSILKMKERYESR